jgi:hypothetical protein
MFDRFEAISNGILRQPSVAVVCARIFILIESDFATTTLKSRWPPRESGHR